MSKDEKSSPSPNHGLPFDPAHLLGVHSMAAAGIPFPHLAHFPSPYSLLTQPPSFPGLFGSLGSIPHPLHAAALSHSLAAGATDWWRLTPDTLPPISAPLPSSSSSLTAAMVSSPTPSSNSCTTTSPGTSTAVSAGTPTTSTVVVSDGGLAAVASNPTGLNFLVGNLGAGVVAPHAIGPLGGFDSAKSNISLLLTSLMELPKPSSYYGLPKHPSELASPSPPSSSPSRKGGRSSRSPASTTTSSSSHRHSMSRSPSSPSTSSAHTITSASSYLPSWPLNGSVYPFSHPLSASESKQSSTSSSSSSRKSRKNTNNKSEARSSGNKTGNKIPHAHQHSPLLSIPSAHIPAPMLDSKSGRSLKSGALQFDPHSLISPYHMSPDLAYLSQSLLLHRPDLGLPSPFFSVPPAPMSSCPSSSSSSTGIGLEPGQVVLSSSSMKPSSTSPLSLHTSDRLDDTLKKERKPKEKPDESSRLDRASAGGSSSSHKSRSRESIDGKDMMVDRREEMADRRDALDERLLVDLSQSSHFMDDDRKKQIAEHIRKRISMQDGAAAMLSKHAVHHTDWLDLSMGKGVTNNQADEHARRQPDKPDRHPVVTGSSGLSDRNTRISEGTQGWGESKAEKKLGNCTPETELQKQEEEMRTLKKQFSLEDLKMSSHHEESLSSTCSKGFSETGDDQLGISMLNESLDMHSSTGSESERSSSESCKRTAGGSNDEGSPNKKRCFRLNERELTVPLEHGWSRQTIINGMGRRGIVGEVLYFAPCGKKMKTIPDVMRYLERNPNADLGRESFSFNTKVNVGQFYEVQGHGSAPVALTDSEVLEKIAMSQGKRARMQMLARKRRETAAREQALARQIMESKLKRRMELQDISRRASEMRFEKRLEQQTQKEMEKKERETKVIERRKEKEQYKMLKQQEKMRIQEQLRKEREMRAQQIIEARNRRQKELEVMRLADAVQRNKEREMKRQQLIIMKEQERERRRQHLMLVKALEQRKRQEERQHQRQVELEVAMELKKPVEDMELKNAKLLPEFPRLKSRLPGRPIADCLMVVEFLNNFGLALNLDKSSLPTLESLERGLMNDSEDDVEDLMSLVMHLLRFALDDVGVPNPKEAMTKLNQKITEMEMTDSTMSEILRIFVKARGEKEMSEWLTDKPMEALNSTKKAALLAFLCNELLASKVISCEIDKHMDSINNLRRDKWLVEGQLRQLRVFQARKFNKIHKSTDRRHPSISHTSQLSVGDEDTMSSSKMESDEDEDKDEDEDEEESGNESDGSSSVATCASTNSNAPFEPVDENLSREESDKKIEKLRKQHAAFRQKVFRASLRLRAINIGQDRYKRTYWILPLTGGVYVEGMESGVPEDFQKEKTANTDVKDIEKIEDVKMNGVEEEVDTAGEEWRKLPKKCENGGEVVKAVREDIGSLSGCSGKENLIGVQTADQKGSSRENKLTLEKWENFGKKAKSCVNTDESVPARLQETGCECEDSTDMLAPPDSPAIAAPGDITSTRCATESLCEKIGETAEKGVAGQCGSSENVSGHILDGLTAVSDNKSILACPMETGSSHQHTSCPTPTATANDDSSRVLKDKPGAELAPGANSKDAIATNENSTPDHNCVLEVERSSKLDSINKSFHNCIPDIYAPFKLDSIKKTDHNCVTDVHGSFKLDPVCKTDHNCVSEVHDSPKLDSANTADHNFVSDGHRSSKLDSSNKTDHNCVSDVRGSSKLDSSNKNNYNCVSDVNKFSKDSVNKADHNCVSDVHGSSKLHSVNKTDKNCVTKPEETSISDPLSQTHQSLGTAARQGTCDTIIAQPMNTATADTAMDLHDNHEPLIQRNTIKSGLGKVFEGSVLCSSKTESSGFSQARNDCEYEKSCSPIESTPSEVDPDMAILPAQHVEVKESSTISSSKVVENIVEDSENKSSEGINLSSSDILRVPQVNAGCQETLVSVLNHSIYQAYQEQKREEKPSMKFLSSSMLSPSAADSSAILSSSLLFSAIAKLPHANSCRQPPSSALSLVVPAVGESTSPAVTDLLKPKTKHSVLDLTNPTLSSHPSPAHSKNPQPLPPFHPSAQASPVLDLTPPAAHTGHRSSKLSSIPLQSMGPSSHPHLPQSPYIPGISHHPYGPCSASETLSSLASIISPPPAHHHLPQTVTLSSSHQHLQQAVTSSSVLLQTPSSPRASLPKASNSFPSVDAILKGETPFSSSELLQQAAFQVMRSTENKKLTSSTPHHHSNLSLLSPPLSAAATTASSLSKMTTDDFLSIYTSPKTTPDSGAKPENEVVDHGLWFSILPRMPCDELSLSQPTQATSYYPQSPSTTTPTTSPYMTSPSGLSSLVSHESLLTSLRLLTQPSSLSASPTSCSTPSFDFLGEFKVPQPPDSNAHFDPWDLLRAAQGEAQPIPKNKQHGWWRNYDIAMLRSVMSCTLSRGIRERNLQRSIHRYLDYAHQHCTFDSDKGEVDPHADTTEMTEKERAVRSLERKRNEIKKNKDKKDDIKNNIIKKEDTKKTIEDKEVGSEEVDSPAREEEEEEEESVPGIKTETEVKMEDEEAEDNVEVKREVPSSGPDEADFVTPDEPDSWSVKSMYEIELAVLEEVEALEERIFQASLQAKQGWRPNKQNNLRLVDRSVQEVSDTESYPLDVGIARLLELEANIERRYLKPPLIRSIQLNMTNLSGHSDRSDGDLGDDENVPPGLLLWRQAVVGAQSPAQLSLCTQLLAKSISWEKSIMRVTCQICRKDDNEAELLLCDGCDKGYHTYCFKPKMENIPDGDWYCYECVSKVSGTPHCVVCGNPGGRIVSCQLCPRYIHLDCTDPALPRMPKRWQCLNCVMEKGTSKKSKKRKDKLPVVQRITVTKLLIKEEPRDNDDVPMPDSTATATLSCALTAGVQSEKADPKDASKISNHVESIGQPDLEKKTRKRKEREQIAPATPKKKEKMSKKEKKIKEKKVEEPGEKPKESLTEEKRSDKSVHKDLMSCGKLLTELEKHEHGWPFLKPVSKKQFPCYKKFIKTPMDFSSARGKIKTREYKHRQEFAADMRLIFNNCETFNEDDSEVGRAGYSMKQYFESRWLEVFPEDAS